MVGMSWWPELEKFLFGFLGAILGGSFIAWITGYYSEKGKRQLLREEWPKLMTEARQKSYEEEAGKRLATKEDIGNVLEQIRMVTKETETIKAEISSGLWQRQWHLTQKRDCYARLVDALENIQLQRSSVRKASDDTLRAEARRRNEDAILEFRRARALARLILSPEVISGIGRLLRAIDPFDPASCTEDEYASSKKLINVARNKVVDFGRRELGLVKESVSGAIEDE
jgi:hypothetical protein